MTALTRHRKWFSRRLGLIVAVGAVLAAILATAAFALHARAGRAASVENATLQLQINTSWGQQATVWTGTDAQSPNSSCLYMQLANETANPAFNGPSAGGCPPAVSAALANQYPILPHMSGVLLPSGQYGIVISGEITPGSSATRVALSAPSATATSSFQFKNGYFLGELPATTISGSFPGTWQLVAYDASGQEVGSVDLNAMIPSHPNG